VEIKRHCTLKLYEGTGEKDTLRGSVEARDTSLCALCIFSNKDQVQIIVHPEGRTESSLKSALVVIVPWSFIRLPSDLVSPAGALVTLSDSYPR
jgi:hypothetical protein